MDNKSTRVFPDFADEVMKIDSRLSVVQNPNHKGLANIKLDGRDICPIPSGEILDEPDPGYTIEFPNGYVCKHRSRREALELVHDRLEMIKTKEGADIFFARE